LDSNIFGWGYLREGGNIEGNPTGLYCFRVRGNITINLIKRYE